MGVSRIFWDTNLFIYLFEGNGELSEKVRVLRQKMLERGDELITSSLTLGEILVKPRRLNDFESCALYEKALTTSALLVSFDATVALRYAAIRSQTGIKGPDAIQLSCAGEAGVDLFITNDTRLQGKRVDGIQFIVALDQVPI